MYLAHISEDGKRIQTILEHLQGTAKLAGSFADAFHCYDWGYGCGLMHDLGKYSEAFQRRLKGGEKVDHATAGARELNGINTIAAYCIAGHHSGLLDVGSSADIGGEPTFQGRMKKKLEYYMEYKREIAIPTFPDPPLQFFGYGGFTKSFFTRMLFSCLVDADYLDTESFMKTEEIKRHTYDAMDKIYEHFMQHVTPWFDCKETHTINGYRTKILKACVHIGKEKQGIYHLSVPTGSGKTISSLAFALEHARKHNLKRIIYVIPYTSIIDQNAQVFKEIIGKNNVLEDYYNVVYDDEIELKQKQLATENWDMPVVVTTNVQFFESLFSNKTSKCRKLHNISESVIIFDEAQMLPTDYLMPCIWAMNELVYNYHSSIVLCTATQPALEQFFTKIKRMPTFDNSAFEIVDICPCDNELHTFFKRANIAFEGTIHTSDVLEKMNKKTQVLCILNNRKQVQNIYEKIRGKGIFHLSTTMYPKNRTRILNKINKCLKEGMLCKVIATSLVEAGVDLDFNCVLRELAGLDSIKQAAGRCNREGKGKRDECITTVFQFHEDDAMPIPQSLKIPISITKQMLEKYDDITSEEAIHEYFLRLFHHRGEQLDKKEVIQAFEKEFRTLSFPFQSIAKKFHIIDNQSFSVLVAIEDEAKELTEEIRQGNISRDIMRKAGQYIVQLFANDFDAFQGAGLLELLDNELYLLRDESHYTEEEGLLLNVSRGDAIQI